MSTINEHLELLEILEKQLSRLPHGPGSQRTASELDEVKRLKIEMGKICYEVGLAYEQDGVINGNKEHFVKAVEYYSMAADRYNHSDASEKLGLGLEKGSSSDYPEQALPDPIPTDDVLCLRTAQQYHGGIGLKKNLRNAAILYQHAINKGNMSAISKLPFALYQLGGERNHQKARELYEQTNDGNRASVLVNLAFMNEYGFGGERNSKKAIALYLQAYDKGSDVVKSHSLMQVRGLVSRASLPLRAISQYLDNNNQNEMVDAIKEALKENLKPFDFSHCYHAAVLLNDQESLNWMFDQEPEELYGLMKVDSKLAELAQSRVVNIFAMLGDYFEDHFSEKKSVNDKVEQKFIHFVKLVRLAAAGDQVKVLNHIADGKRQICLLPALSGIFKHVPLKTMGYIDYLDMIKTLTMKHPTAIQAFASEVKEAMESSSSKMVSSNVRDAVKMVNSGKSLSKPELVIMDTEQDNRSNAVVGFFSGVRKSVSDVAQKFNAVVSQIGL